MARCSSCRRDDPDKPEMIEVHTISGNDNSARVIPGAEPTASAPYAPPRRKRQSLICPTGQVLTRKIFLFFRNANQANNGLVSPEKRGGSRSSRTRGGMRWTRIVQKTSARDADGEVVWS